MHNHGHDSDNLLIHGRNLNSMGGHGCNLKGECQALNATALGRG